MIAAFLSGSKVSTLHVRYEDLVENPESEAGKILEFAGLKFEDSVVNYGDSVNKEFRLGDPIQAFKAKAPNKDSLNRWRHELVSNPAKIHYALNMLGDLGNEDVKTYGYDLDDLKAQLKALPQEKRLFRFEKRLLRLRPWVWIVLLKLMKISRVKALMKSLRHYSTLLLEKDLQS